MGVSGFLAYVGYFSLHFYFFSGDDEGYWLTSIRSYHLHGSLYHDTFTQAGPFYYEAWSLVYSVLGLRIDWDTGRLLTLVTWVGTSLIYGMAIWILSRRIVLGLLTQIVSFLVLFPLIAVPMEPAGLAHLLAACVVLGVALFVRQRRRLGMVIVGLASPALLLTKINIGVFVITGLIAAVAICWPSSRWATSRTIVVVLGLLALPLLLMQHVLTQPWAWHFGVVEVLYISGLVGIVVTSGTSPRSFAVRDILLALAAAIGSVVLIALGVLINGTSLPTLIYGAIFRQRSFGAAGHVALPITAAEVVVTVVGSAAALAVALYTMVRGRRPGWLGSASSAYVRLAVGIWILLTMCGDPGATPHGLVLTPSITLQLPGLTFLLAAPFAWVAALGGRGVEDGAFRFARVAVCLIGVLGCLEAFPIAGAQQWWAAVAMVPVGVLCIFDGLSMLSPLPGRLRWTTPGVLAVPLGSLVVTVLAVFLVLGNVGQVLSLYRGAYYATVPLRLSGAITVHLPLQQVEDLRSVTSFLRKNCSTYWSLPGFDSFYFFSRESPPTDLNLSQAWWTEFTRDEQDRILDRLRHTSRLCVIEDSVFADHKYQAQVPQTRLIRYIESEFVLARTAGGFHLLVHRPEHS